MELKKIFNLRKMARNMMKYKEFALNNNVDISWEDYLLLQKDPWLMDENEYNIYLKLNEKLNK